MALVCSRSQSETVNSPNNGMSWSQSGCGGSLNELSAVHHETMRSKFCVIVATASQNGAINTTSSATVMTVTASQRRSHRRRCTRNINGHVAVTRVVAQIVAGRKGHKIQNETAMSPDTNRIASNVRTRDR